MQAIRKEALETGCPIDIEEYAAIPGIIGPFEKDLSKSFRYEYW